MEGILIRQIALPPKKYIFYFFENYIVLKTSMRLAATIVGRNSGNISVRRDKIRENYFLKF